MEIQENIINKVAQSGLLSLDLADFYPSGERMLYDIKDNLFQGLMLREKDFREFIKEHNWEAYSGKHIAISCSVDAIVPTWAYMLLATQLEPYVKKVVFGNLEVLETVLYTEILSQLNINNYKDARVVIKGCGHLPVPKAAYVEIARLLRPVAKSIMYGEACSTVPLYKQAK